MPQLKNRQYRNMPLLVTRAGEQQDGKEYNVEGYATTFEPYLLYEDMDGPIYEQFSPECFKGCDMSDVIFQFDHQGRVFARQSNNTLTLEVDEHGLKINADLSSTTSSRGIHEDIAAGLITKMSWGFLPGEYYYDKDTRTIIHTKVKKIFDVSAVSMPANNDTNINARSFADGVISNVLEECKKRAKAKVRTKIKLAKGETKCQQKKD